MLIVLVENCLSILCSQEEMLLLEKTYKNDVTKLERILRNQMQQKHLFQNDIKNLKLKTKSQDSIRFRGIMSWNDKGNEKIREILTFDKEKSPCASNYYQYVLVVTLRKLGIYYLINPFSLLTVIPR